MIKFFAQRLHNDFDVEQTRNSSKVAAISLAIEIPPHTHTPHVQFQSTVDNRELTVDMFNFKIGRADMQTQCHVWGQFHFRNHLQGNRRYRWRNRQRQKQTLKINQSASFKFLPWCAFTFFNISLILHGIINMNSCLRFTGVYFEDCNGIPCLINLKQNERDLMTAYLF